VTTRALPSRPPIAIALFLVVTGLVGLFGAFNLVLDEFKVAADPNAKLGCNVNPFISCTDVMSSWQGHLFGFPNPVLGAMGFVAPVAVGVILLVGGVIRARPFWLAFNLGVFLAWVFVTWLFTQTVWFIGALCPWCMLVWAVTIPMFWVFTCWNLAKGNLPFGAAAQRIGAAVLPFSWAIVLANYLFIALTILVEFPGLRSIIF
jgi:uncharacterized membrane protein